MKFCRRPLFLLSIIFLLSGYCNSFAQTVKLSDKVTFSANNITVSDALESLTRQTGTAFSYNPDQLPANKIVRVDIVNKPLIEVLHAILGSTSFGYRQMGNQVIIYKTREDNAPTESPVNTDQLTSGTKPVNNVQHSNQPVIVYKTDTLIREVRDTVTVTEYIIQRDTIYQKVETPVTGNDIFSSTADLGKELIPGWRLDLGINAGYFLPMAGYNATENYSEKIKQYKDSYSSDVFSGYTGLAINASYRHLTLSAGLGATLFSQKLDYTYLKETGGFYQKDTLDKYYTLTETDTTWYYILDSSYIPKDNELFNYKINNHVRYLEIPLTVQYNHAVQKMLLYGNAGIITGFHIGSDGQLIHSEEDGIISLRNLKARSLIFSWTVSAGIALPVSNKLIFRSSLSLRNHLNSIYKEFPIQTKFLAFGVNAGISYKLY